MPARRAGFKGVDLDVLAEESLRRHELGYPTQADERLPVLPNLGEFHWRAEGERHMWDPQAIADLQVAARENSADAYCRFAKHANEDATRKCALRGLLKFKDGANRPIPHRGGRAGQGNRQAVLHRRDELRLDLGRGP